MRRRQATHLVDCANWAESARWTIPSDAVSGLYFARLVRTDPIEPTYGPRATQNNWRADWSSKRVDWHHTRPGVDPYAPPEKLPHAYGALGHGAPQNALIEPRASHVYFVVRDDDGDAEILLQTSDATWQAYNGWGGLTTYGSFDFPYTHYGDDAPQPMNVDVASSSPPRAYKASYNRPLITRDYRAVNAPLNSEYPAIRFLESAGFSVSYFTDVDAARRGKRILQHKLFISVGHNEYASGAQRQAIEDARDAGVHLMFWSGNEFYWRIRFEDDFRTLVCYKESQSNVKLDPMGGEWTGTFRDARSINPLGANPENALTGTIFTANAQRFDSLIVPASFSALRQWRHTPISALRPGERFVSKRGVLGHEFDSVIDNGFSPPGLIELSETYVDNVQYIMDHGSIFDTGTARHSIALYRSRSGSLVFGAAPFSGHGHLIQTTMPTIRPAQTCIPLEWKMIRLVPSSHSSSSRSMYYQIWASLPMLARCRRTIPSSFLMPGIPSFWASHPKRWYPAPACCLQAPEASSLSPPALKLKLPGAPWLPLNAPSMVASDGTKHSVLLSTPPQRRGL